MAEKDVEISYRELWIADIKEISYLCGTERH